MSMPFYVSPEQLMKDKADYARKGIARGRSVVVLQYDRGIVFVAENPQSLRKISEIYDRIAFAAVGMYYEFENLRVAGIRYADLRGYSYDRSDVSARGLANAYAQTLGTVFTQEPKPYEIEICVAEVGATPERDQIFRLTYDGSVADQHGFVVMGGSNQAAEERLKAGWQEGMPLADALILAVAALAADPAGGEPRTLSPDQLEVAVQDVPHRLPVHARGLHGHVLHPERLQPIGQRQQSCGGGLKRSHVLGHRPIAGNARTSHHRLLVHIQSRAARIDHFHDSLLFAAPSACNPRHRTLRCVLKGQRPQATVWGAREAAGPTEIRVRSTKYKPTSVPRVAVNIEHPFHRLRVARSAMDN